MRLDIITVSAFAALALILSACGAPRDGSGDRLRVVATTTQVGSLAREVGGDAIELTVLLQPGMEAHDFEMTPVAAAALEDADLILLSGAGLETWLTDALDTIAKTDAVLEMSDGVRLRSIDSGDGTGSEVDPHYWLSGPNSIVMTENVRDALVEAAPAVADGFVERANALVARLEAADAEIRRLMDEIPAERRGIVTNHDALGYFIDEYGLRHVGSIFPSLDVSAEPNPSQLADLVSVIREAGVTAVFSESAVNPRLAEAIATESGARVVDDPLFTDSMGPPGTAADTLDGVLLHNARVIHDALVGP